MKLNCFTKLKNIFTVLMTVTLLTVSSFTGINSEANAHGGMGGGGMGGGSCPSYAPVPQYPSFSCGTPGYRSCPPTYMPPGGCMPGFNPGCIPFIPQVPFVPAFFGPSVIFDSSTFEVPAGFSAPPEKSATDRIQELLPSLENDAEIPDTTKSSDTDISDTLGDVFKTPKAPADNECGTASLLCKSGKFKEAVAAIDNEAARHPLGGMCNYVRASANLGLGNLEEALKDIDKAIAQSPGFAPAQYTRGSILAAMNRLKEAIDAYSKALNLRPKYPPYLNARAGVFYRIGEFIDAIRDYEVVLTVDAVNPGALYMRGLSYFMIGQYGMVIVSLNDYVSKNPKDAAAFYNRGSAYFELGNYQAAVADFNEAIALQPKYIPCLYKRCLAYWHLGQWQPALDDANTALSNAGWQDDNSAYLALCAYFISLRKKQMDKVSTIVADSVSKLDPKKWPYPLFLYLKGELSETELLARAVTDSQKTQARTYIALNLSWSGQDKTKANSLLESVRSLGDSSVPEYNLAINEIYGNKIKDVVNATRPVGKKYALIVGVSKFKDQTINLKYADKDATDFHNFLISSGHFPKENVRLMVNEEATRENILGALGENWLPRIANKDDLVLVYFSTHGSPSAMDAKGLNYLVAHNTDKQVLYATGIPVQDLTRMIKDKVHADRVVVIMDACHSGAAEAGEKLKITADALSQSSGQSVICSSLPEELSWESRAYPNSVFTHHLIDSLKNPKTSISDSFQYTLKHVKDEVWKDRKQFQTPVMKSTWAKTDLSLTEP